MVAALLLADPVPETRLLLEQQLRADGFELVPPTARFDLVLAGADAVERFAQQAPVIVLGCVQANAVDRIHALRRGADDYVGRPFDYQELVAFVSGYS